MFKFVSSKRHNSDISNLDENNFNEISSSTTITTTTTTTLLSKKTPITIIPKNTYSPKTLAKNPNPIKILDCQDTCCSCFDSNYTNTYNNSETGRFYRCCGDSRCTTRTSCCTTTTTKSCTTSLPAQSHISSCCCTRRTPIPPLLYNTKRLCTLRQHLQYLPAASSNSSCTSSHIYLAPGSAHCITNCHCCLVK